MAVHQREPRVTRFSNRQKKIKNENRKLVLADGKLCQIVPNFVIE